MLISSGVRGVCLVSRVVVLLNGVLGTFPLSWLLVVSLCYSRVCVSLRAFVLFVLWVWVTVLLRSGTVCVALWLTVRSWFMAVSTLVRIVGLRLLVVCVRAVLCLSRSVIAGTVLVV